MKKLILFCFLLSSCNKFNPNKNGNSDADYVSGFRQLKAFGKHYVDSVNKESYRIDDSLRAIGKYKY